MLYLCSLPNPGKPGTPHEFLTHDWRQAEDWARGEDRPGRGVYYCVNPLREGARTRAKETVAAITGLHVDIDFKDIDENAGEVDRRLQCLPCPPSEIRNSGGGRHAWWQLESPIEADDPDYETTEALLKRLTDCLCGDRAPAHPAALLRMPGTMNSKREPAARCEILVKNEWTYSVSDIEAMLDLLADAPMLTRKEVARPVPNGRDCDLPSGFAGYLTTRRVDVEASLARLRAATSGGEVNALQCSIVAALLRRGEHPDDVLGVVVDATLAAPIAKAGELWTRAAEVTAVSLRIIAAYRLFMRDYDPASGAVPDWLPGEFHGRWIDALAQGRRPLFGRNKAGFFLRASWDTKKAADPASPAGDTPSSFAGSDESQSDARKAGPGGNGPKHKARDAGPKIFSIVPFTRRDPHTLPPRSWLYGKHYQRKVVSATIAPGGTGKSSVDLTEAIAMATARNLLGEQPELRLRVWYHNGEDDRDEIDRRILAICQHYGIPQEELEGWLFVTSGAEVPLRVAAGYSNLEINEVLVRQLREAIGDLKLDVATLDPLITLHGVPEGDNGKMYRVIRVFADLGNELDCAFELAHHTRKGPPGNIPYEYSVDDMRGASAVRDAVRAARVLNHMTAAEAQEVGIPEHDRASYFRVDRAKGNYSRPARVATWRQFVSVDLPNDDDVGVVAPWEFPGQGVPSPAKEAAEHKAEQVFLTLLDKFAARGANVSVNAGTTYAPAKFAAEREAAVAEVSKAALVAAMRRLLDSGRIRSEEHGRGRHHLVRKRS